MSILQHSHHAQPFDSASSRVNRRTFLRYASGLTLAATASCSGVLRLLAAVPAEAQTLQLALADGQQLCYHLRQAADAKGICYFVHGLGDASSSFAKVIDAVVGFGYHAVFYDLPGFGENNALTGDFEQNCAVLNDLIKQHSTGDLPNYAIGHSMGGLILLLTFAKYAPAVKFSKLLTIEPSLTPPDAQFYAWVQEPPAGVGYQGLLDAAKTWTDAYSPTYAENVARASATVFKTDVQQVMANFDAYRQQILDSDLPFVYVYGTKSSGVPDRQQLATYPQITVQSFENAAHWVHIDAEPAFLEFLKTHFFA